jgi:hypothetical protein
MRDLVRILKKLRTDMRSRWAALALTLAVAGCGGGGVIALLAEGVGSGGTGIILGTLTGFGSVVVDDLRLDSDTAAILVESEPGNPNKAGVDAQQLQVGHNVAISSDNDATTATTIRVLPLIIGTVEAVQPALNRLTVAGQDVLLNTDPAAGPPAVLDGYEQLADVAVGDLVAVHGHLTGTAASTSNPVQARRIELQASGYVQTRVTGFIRNLDSARSRFQINGLTVDASQARLLEAGTQLAEGRRVVVWAPAVPVAGKLAAQVLSMDTSANAAKVLRLGGVVAGCGGTCGNSLVVDGQSIDLSKATFSGGARSQLADGRYVHVVGTLDSATGMLAASTVTMRSAASTDVTLWGTAIGTVANQFFNLQKVTVQLGTSTVVASGCAVADGQALKVQGTIVGNTVLATGISCASSYEGLTVDLGGVVGNLSTGSQTFSLPAPLGSALVNFKDATFADGSATDLRNGSYVIVSGKLSKGVLKAREVRVSTPPASLQFDDTGKAYQVKSTSFRLNGVVVHYAAGLVQAGSLKTGSNLRVRLARRNDGDFDAITIKVL